ENGPRGARRLRGALRRPRDLHAAVRRQGPGLPRGRGARFPADLVRVPSRPREAKRRDCAMKKILLAGLLGGLLNFVWGAVFHMVLPFGKMGISTIRNEEAVLPAIRTGVPEPGLYFFPWMEEPPNASEVQKKAIQDEWAAKFRRGPSGLLI